MIGQDDTRSYADVDGGRLDATVIPNSSARLAAAKGMTVLANIAERAYDSYYDVFSFPPRTGRKGLQDVLEIIQAESAGRPKTGFALNRFLDESIMDELEQEGFFKKLSAGTSAGKPR
jgi:hypothetical protein